MAYSYFRINAVSEIPVSILPDTNLHAGLFDESAENGYVHHDSSSMMLWDMNGKRRKFTILFDGEGLLKRLVPNHRFNAMCDFGRYTDGNMDTVDDSANQAKKDSWGANYYVGNVLVEVPDGDSPPNVSVYGENPIVYLFKKRNIVPSPRMVAQWGEEVAKRKLHPLMAIVFQPPFDIMTIPWKAKKYNLWCSSASTNDEYQNRLKDWGLENFVKLYVLYMELKARGADDSALTMLSELIEMTLEETLSGEK